MYFCRFYVPDINHLSEKENLSIKNLFHHAWEDIREARKLKRSEEVLCKPKFELQYF